jgi:hypothetical protein
VTPRFDFLATCGAVTRRGRPPGFCLAPRASDASPGRRRAWWPDDRRHRAQDLFVFLGKVVDRALPARPLKDQYAMSSVTLCLLGGRAVSLEEAELDIDRVLASLKALMTRLVVADPAKLDVGEILTKLSQSQVTRRSASCTWGRKSEFVSYSPSS